MSKTILEVQNLKKYFKTGRGELHAVDGVSFSLEEGHTLGIVGESGCGKSTAGRCIIRLIEPTSGNIIFEGKDISKLGRLAMRKYRRDMQIIFQDPFSSLDPRNTVTQIIAEGVKSTNKFKSRKEIDDRVLELMEIVGLAERLKNSYPHELDGGRRQRIGIARALAVEPKLIVCDEPVSALDVSIQAQILNLLQDLQQEKGLTYMFITHNLSVVRHISHKILVMYLGCQVELCDSKELFKKPLHPYTKGLLSAIPIPSIHVKRDEILMTGEVTSPINPKPGCRFAARCPYAKDKCHESLPAVEEVEPGHFCACHYVREINQL